MIMVVDLSPSAGALAGEASVGAVILRCPKPGEENGQETASACAPRPKPRLFEQVPHPHMPRLESVLLITTSQARTTADTKTKH